MDNLLRRGPDALHDELAELLKQFNKTDKAVQEPQPPIKLLAKAETMTRSLVGLAKQVDLAKLVHLAKAKLPTLWPRGAMGNDEDPSGDWQTPARRGFLVVFLTFGVFGGWTALA